MKLNSVAVRWAWSSPSPAVTWSGIVQPTVFIPEQNPPVVWVTYTDNSFVPVSEPKIVGDSLMGTWQGLAEPVAIL